MVRPQPVPFKREARTAVAVLHVRSQQVNTSGPEFPGRHKDVIDPGLIRE